MNIFVVGGAGSGKSLVLDILERDYHASIYQNDKIAHMLYEKGQAGYEAVINLLGESVLDDDKNLDRNIMAQILYSSPDKLKSLESRIHPLVWEYAYDVLSANVSSLDRKDAVDKATDMHDVKLGEMQYCELQLCDECTCESCVDTYKKRISCDEAGDEQIESERIVVLESALLYDGKDKMYELFDDIWFVYVSDEIRRERLKKTRGYTDSRVDEIFAIQPSQNEYRSISTFVIENMDSKNILSKKIKARMDEVMRKLG